MADTARHRLPADPSTVAAILDQVEKPLPLTPAGRASLDRLAADLPDAIADLVGDTGKE